MSDYTIIVEESDNLIIEVGIQGPVGATGIISTPSSGQYQITNIRLDADKKIIITYDETPAT